MKPPGAGSPWTQSGEQGLYPAGWVHGRQWSDRDEGTGDTPGVSLMVKLGFRGTGDAGEGW